MGDGEEDDKWAALLNSLKVRLEAEPLNKYDENAVKVQVYSRKRKAWACIGYVPRKVNFKKGNRTEPLNKIMLVLMKYDRIASLHVEELGRFYPDDKRGPVYYCKLVIDILE